MRGDFRADSFGTTPSKVGVIFCPGAASVTLYVKNNHASQAFNHFSIRSKPNRAATPCVRYTASGFSGVAFDMTGAAATTNTLAAGVENELRFPTLGCDTFEVWAGVASGTGAIIGSYSSDSTRL